MLEYGNELKEIINRYKDGNNEPLDGDETERLANILLAQMDLMEGNITNREYEEKVF